MGTDAREEETPTMPLIVVRVTAEATTVDEFVARFARYVRDDQVLFVPTEGVQPSGRRVRFVFALKGGEEVVVGEGVVLRMRRDSGDPRRPPGMELRYQIDDEASQAIVARLLAARVTPPPYLSMRIDGVADSQQVTVPVSKVEAPPLGPPPVGPPPIPLTASMVKRPSARLATVATLPAMPIVSPDESSRGWRLLGVGLATAAAVLAMALAMAMIRKATPLPATTRASATTTRATTQHATAAHATPPPVAHVAVGGNGVVVPAKAPLASAPRQRASARAVALHVTTSPTGSRIFVDGEERGASPLHVAVAPGAHDIVAERPRWVAAHAHVDGAGHVQLTLERPSARLRIVTATPGAAVRVDGRDVGATPLELDAAAYEQHRVRVTLDGGRVWRRNLYLRPPGRTVSIDEPGAVRVADDLGKRVSP